MSLCTNLYYYYAHFRRFFYALLPYLFLQSEYLPFINHQKNGITLLYEHFPIQKKSNTILFFRYVLLSLSQSNIIFLILMLFLMCILTKIFTYYAVFLHKLRYSISLSRALLLMCFGTSIPTVTYWSP